MMSVFESSSSIPLRQSSSPCPAYLVKFPEAIWEQIASHLDDQDANITIDNGQMSLALGSSTTVPLDANATGLHTEIHQLDANQLVQIGHAAGRLSVPLLSSTKDDPPTRSSSRVPTARSLAKPVPVPATPPTTSTARPGLPLKTRVMQALALGPATIAQVAIRAGAAEADVMRIAKVIGKEAGGDWVLSPLQYSKIKLDGYSADELATVCLLARAAFDECNFASDAPERRELDDKEQARLESLQNTTKAPSPPTPPPQPSPPAPPEKRVKEVTAIPDPIRTTKESPPSPPKPAEIKTARPAARKRTNKQSKRRSHSPQFTSSEEDEPERPDPEALRDRYEELYPAYQIATERLVELHRAADAGEPVAGDIAKLVQKWEKWHAELASIRKWFA